MTTGKFVVSVVVAATLAAFGARAFVAQRIASQLDENKQLEAALKALRRETAEADALHDLVADFLSRSTVAKVVRDYSSPAAEAFAELSRLPNDIVLTRAQANEMQLVATGVARNEAVARKMVEQLGASRFITNPRIARIDPAPAHDPFGAEARTFQLEADLKR